MATHTHKYKMNMLHMNAHEGLHVIVILSLFPGLYKHTDTHIHTHTIQLGHNGVVMMRETQS